MRQRISVREQEQHASQGTQKTQVCSGMAASSIPTIRRKNGTSYKVNGNPLVRSKERSTILVTAVSGFLMRLAICRAIWLLLQDCKTASG
jgi:hypothetical protein